LTSPLTLRDDARVLLRVYLSGLVLLAGCATHPSVSRVSVHQTPARLEVLELPPSVEDRPLRRVLHGKREEATAATLIEDRQRINHSLEATVRENLPCIASSTGAPAEITRIDDPSVRIGRPIDTASLSRLQSSHPADAYVRLRVTDYGETPRRWEGAYIGFEVVTTLAIGAGLYVHRITRPVAVAYLLEESIEEFSEGYAGFWALNRMSRPVRIEADILDGQTGGVVRRDVHVGLAPWRLRHLSHMDDTTRDELLATSMQKAVRALARNICTGLPTATAAARAPGE
jgi:hypothetical protein